MKGWEYQKIGDFSEIGRGSSPRPIIDQAYFVNGNIPWIKIADATASFKYIYRTKEYVNEYGSSFSRKLSPGTLILAASGTLGFPIFLGVEGCIHDGWLYFKSINKNVDKQYLYYCLITFIKSFNSFSYGAAIQNINTDILRNTEIPLPPLPIQKKIAAILSAYDDLIENNNRRIAILEKMAEELYREWFVRLRFPRHEKVKVVKGVPEGWEVVSAGKYFKLVKGRSYSSEEIEDYEATENHRFFITLKNFKRGGGFRKDAIKYYCGKYNANQVVSGGSLVIAVTDMTQDRAVIGRIARIPFGIPKSIISCDVVKIEPINISDSFLYALLRFTSYSESLKEFANGANVLHLKPELATVQKIIIPPKLLRDSFDDKFKPLIKAMDNINNTLELLATSRERLLSRLIIGKIDTENMDIQFPASMQEELAHA